MEDLDHLFLSCDYFWKIWDDILHYLGFIMVQQTQVAHHFYQFGTLASFSKSVRLVFNLMSLLSVD